MQVDPASDHQVDKQALKGVWWGAGPPQLMMAFTGDGQIDPKLIEARDKREGKSTSDLAEHRKKLNYPDITNPEADSWVEKGIAWQTEMKQLPLQK